MATVTLKKERKKKITESTGGSVFLLFYKMVKALNNVKLWSYSMLPGKNIR